MKKIKNDETVEGNNFSDGNNFYIYDYFEEDMWQSIILPFDKVVKTQLEKVKKEDINIYINSGGGRVDICLELAARIERAKKNGIKVNTYVEYEACSAASIIAVMGTKRYVSERAMNLVHYPRGFGNYSHNPKMQERNHEKFMYLMKHCEEHYRKYTKLRDVKKKIETDNYWILGGKKLIEMGFADEII